MSYDLREGHCLDLIAELQGDSVNVCVTSPPFWNSDYDVPLVDGWGRLGCEDQADNYVAHVAQILAAVGSKLRRDGMVWLVLRDSLDDLGRLQGLPARIGTAAEAHRLSWVYTVYWVPDALWMPKGYTAYGPMPAVVPILGLCHEPRAHYWAEGCTVPDYLVYPTPEPERGLPFQALPSNVVGDLLEWSCPSGGTVLDPMCGSGTVIATANIMGHYGIGMDICKKAIKASRRKVVRLKERARAFRQDAAANAAGAVPSPGEESKN